MSNYVVRYGAMRHLGVMSSRVDALQRGDRVVSRTNRGLEVADVLCEATEDALSHLDDSANGQVLRRMTPEDENDLKHIETRRDEIFVACRNHIRELKLDMQMVDVEQLLGGERIIVYYLAEHRVDFRELVRALASELQTRIEMRQIGVRDEAKLLADYGDCGKPVCCNTHLSKMPPVSMKMAKLQKATLDPNKISGRCGRLKCCLRYEYDTYEAIYKELPPIGSEILTRDGKCWVLNQEILAEQLLVETEDHRRRLVHASEVLTIVRRGSNRGGRGKRRDSGRSSSKPAESATSAPPAKTEQKPPTDEPRQTAGDAQPSPTTDADGANESGVNESTSNPRESSKPPRKRRGKRRDPKGGRSGEGGTTADPKPQNAPAESSLPTQPNKPSQGSNQQAAKRDSESRQSDSDNAPQADQEPRVAPQPIDTRRGEDPTSQSEGNDSTPARKSPPQDPTNES